MLRSVSARLKAELEAPRHERRFSSGWISGTLALAAALAAFLLVLALRDPALFTTPELKAIRDSDYFRVGVFAMLVAAYGLATLSLVLRADKTLGVTAMTVTLAASLMGSLPQHEQAIRLGGMFLGLDFFVLNVLFLGFLFLPLERLFPRHAEQGVLRGEWREDLFYYLISSLFVQMLTFLTLAPSHFIVAHARFTELRASIGEWPFLLQLAAIMVLTDLVQYWVHRLFHQVPFLWRFHAVHHSARAMDWIAGARMHFLEIIALRSVTATPMFVLGFHESAIQTYILIVYIYSSFIHANIGIRFGLLEKLVVVPRFHHWHHGVEREAIDVNFAIHFPLIDRLFGTHHMPEDRWPEGYGIAGHPVPRGYWRQFLYPFRRG